jgi:hypothetical protein
MFRGVFLNARVEPVPLENEELTIPVFVVYWNVRQKISGDLMHKYLKTTAALVILSALAAFYVSCSDDDILSPVNEPVLGPVLDYTDTLFEFGTAPQFSTVSHIFWLYSRGTDTLRILSIQPG